MNVVAIIMGFPVDIAKNVLLILTQIQYECHTK